MHINGGFHTIAGWVLARVGRGVLPGLALVAGLTGCANKQRLPEYDFRNRSIAIVTIAPPRPEILSGSDFSATLADNAVDRAIAVGGAIVKEASARQALPRLEEAAVGAEIEDRISVRVLDSAARHLRAVPVPEPGGTDFEIEVRIHRYGINATSWSGDTNFHIDAELFLLDGQTGRRIWKKRVRESTPVRPLVESGDAAVDGAVSAIALSRMSTEEIQRQLESLADHTADELIANLISALDQTRE